MIIVVVLILVGVVVWNLVAAGLPWLFWIVLAGVACVPLLSLILSRVFGSSDS